MPAAVVDLTQGDDETGHPVVNVIMADPAVDAAPDGCVLVTTTNGAGIGWTWMEAGDFVPPPPPPVDEAGE